MQLSFRLRIALCNCAMVALASPWFQVAPVSGTPPRAEMTQADLLSRKEWTSTEVQVAGLYLGMARSAASASASKNGFHLMQYGPPLYNLLPCSDYFYCFLASPQGLSDDVSIRLGKRDEIVEIDLDVRPLEYRGRILREMKGQAYRFFHDVYSDAERLELFGPETRRELSEGGYSPVAKDTRYIYAKRGIAITVSPNPMTAPVPELVTLSLIPPADAARLAR